MLSHSWRGCLIQRGKSEISQSTPSIKRCSNRVNKHTTVFSQRNQMACEDGRYCHENQRRPRGRGNCDGRGAWRRISLARHASRRVTANRVQASGANEPRRCPKKNRETCLWYVPGRTTCTQAHGRTANTTHKRKHLEARLLDTP